MRSRVAIVGVAVVALLAASCADDGDRPEVAGPSSSVVTAGADPTATTVDATRTATIRITQQQTACCYTEGQISFLRLRGDADVVLDRGFAPAATTAVLAEVSVKLGIYRLESWQRPCSASCPALDEQGQPIPGRGGLDSGRRDECSTEITVAAGDVTNVLVSFAPTEGCTISLPTRQPESDVPDEVALRRPYSTCGLDFGLEELAFFGEELIGDLGPNGLRRCFLDAYNAGRQAELEAYEATEEPEILRRVIYRAKGDGTIEVFYHKAPRWNRWFRYTCTGLDPAPPGHEFTTTGCADPVPIG